MLAPGGGVHHPQCAVVGAVVGAGMSAGVGAVHPVGGGDDVGVGGERVGVMGT